MLFMVIDNINSFQYSVLGFCAQLARVQVPVYLMLQTYIRKTLHFLAETCCPISLTDNINRKQNFLFPSGTVHYN